MSSEVAMQAGRQVEAMIQDLRFAIRFLLRERTFTATVLVILASSIGATAAVFSSSRSFSSMA